MKASDFRAHCKQVTTWVDWDRTVDQFMHGGPDVDVKGIAVTWLATDAVLRKAAQLGRNFVVAHEGMFYPTFAGFESEERHHDHKRRLIDDLGITVMRCHDTWDRMPEFGIPDVWADFLGFSSEPRAVDSFYKICLVDGMTVQDVAEAVLAKVKPLAQMVVNVMGNLEKRVSRLAVGTGAITRLPAMHELGADVILATDDGTHTTNSGLWSLDLDIPVLIVSHATAELPGMMALADYIRGRFPGIPVDYLPCGFPCAAVM